MSKRVVGVGNAGMLVAMASALAGGRVWDGLGWAPPIDISGIDIKAEYDLIQQKQSRLSSNQRRYVVAVYERMVRKGEAV